MRLPRQVNLACAEMMVHYGIPHCRTSGSGTGWSMEKWVEAGQPHVQKKLSEYTIEFLKNLPVPDDHAELMQKGEEFIREWKVKSKM